MRRSAARCRMASRSPGRNRIVIRSRAGPLPEGQGSRSGDCAWSQARMAISASLDSDICRWAAIAVNARFSSSVGRAVIVGASDFRAPSFTARKLQLQQNADTSLSCHHSNNDPTTLLDPKFLLFPIRQYGPKRLHDLVSVGGLSSAAYSAQLLRTRASPAEIDAQTPVVRVRQREKYQARPGHDRSLNH
jgi:hypothetical protein